ncbi:hypothetical protein ABZ814_14400 [Micromonospora musae]|uniref:hypothetical protein n=1 Tax=Micromonospora musae TaxID=1894970 RepID=UPI0033CEAC86
MNGTFPPDGSVQFNVIALKSSCNRTSPGGGPVTAEADGVVAAAPFSPPTTRAPTPVAAAAAATTTAAVTATVVAARLRPRRPGSSGAGPVGPDTGGCGPPGSAACWVFQPPVGTPAPVTCGVTRGSAPVGACAAAKFTGSVDGCGAGSVRGVDSDVGVDAGVPGSTCNSAVAPHGSAFGPHAGAGGMLAAGEPPPGSPAVGADRAGVLVGGAGTGDPPNGGGGIGGARTGGTGAGCDWPGESTCPVADADTGPA